LRLPLVDLLDRRTRRWIAGVATLQVAVRVTLVVATIQLARVRVGPVAAASAAVGLLYTLQGAGRAILRRDARQRVVATATEALFRTDVLQTSPIADRDTEIAVFQALYHGEQLVSAHLPDLIGDAIACVIIAALVIWTVPFRVVLLAATAVLLGGLAAMIARRTTRRVQRELEKVTPPVYEGLSNAARGRLDIVATGRDPEFFRELDALTTRWTSTALRVDRMSGVAGRAPIIAAAVGAGLVILIDEAMHGGIRGDALERAALLAVSIPAFASVARASLAITRVREQLRPFAELITAPTRITGGSVPVPAATSIAFESVTFAYPGSSRAALEKVTFAFNAPGILAFAGHNGSGKSSCLRLILGLGEPREGRIIVAGANLLETDLLGWRRRIAYLPQRPFLPERASVRDTVRLLARNADDSAIATVLSRVELLDVLEAQSPGAPLDVPVATLSVGQRQRVAIARALAQEAEILVFDEPDANLDHAGVLRVARILRDAARDRIVIVAAHTEELVGAAEKVVRLAEGRIVG